LTGEPRVEARLVRHEEPRRFRKAFAGCPTRGRLEMGHASGEGTAEILRPRPRAATLRRTAKPGGCRKGGNMNVLDLRREIVRLEDELRHARDQKRSAQAEVRITGRRMPPDAYATVWRRIHDLECMVEHARLDL